MKKISKVSLSKIIFRISFLTLIIFGSITVLSSCSGGSTNETGNNSAITDSTQTETDSTQTAGVYICPMDCESGKTYDKPGQCPVCGMDLEKKS